MIQRASTILFLVAIVTPAQCGIFDSLFKPTPYANEEEAIADLKSILKYASQCLYASCAHPYLLGGPADDPFPSCKSWHEKEKHFEGKYKISPNRIKTDHIKWYLNKIQEYNDNICD